MNRAIIREFLETRQIGIYFGMVVLAAIVAIGVPGTVVPESSINPALALMLFVTFLQVPFADLRKAFLQVRFMSALLTANFVVIPLLVTILLRFAPAHPMVRLGILLVLLAPCVDYVVTFSHLGRSDASLLLAATPVLLTMQMLVLPVYITLFLGKEASSLIIHRGPFISAFIWLIIVPLLFAGLVQLWAARTEIGKWILARLGLLPVPATAFVLFLVIAAVMPRVGAVKDMAWTVIPIYITFAIIAPMFGWMIGRLFRLEIPAARAIAFSAGTRNSLVVLPLALAVPGGLPLLPAIIVTQTLIELLSELVYVRLIPQLTKTS